MHVKHPFRLDRRGRTASVGEEEHLRELIEQVLFTSPGERVNRPSFGSGAMQLVFAPGSDEVAAATQFLVQAALQEWLSDRIQVEAVSVEHEDASLVVTVRYMVRRTQERKTAQFERQGGP